MMQWVCKPDYELWPYNVAPQRCYLGPPGLVATLGAPVHASRAHTREARPLHAKRAGQFLQKKLLPQIFCERSELCSVK